MGTTARVRWQEGPIIKPGSEHQAGISQASQPTERVASALVPRAILCAIVLLVCMLAVLQAFLSVHASPRTLVILSTTCSNVLLPLAVAVVAAFFPRDANLLDRRHSIPFGMLHLAWTFSVWLSLRSCPICWRTQDEDEPRSEVIMRLYYRLVLGKQALGTLLIVCRSLSPWCVARVMIASNGAIQAAAILGLSGAFSYPAVVNAEEALYPPGVDFVTAVDLSVWQIFLGLCVTPANRMRLHRLAARCLPRAFPPSRLPTDIERTPLWECGEGGGSSSGGRAPILRDPRFEAWMVQNAVALGLKTDVTTETLNADETKKLLEFAFKQVLETHQRLSEVEGARRAELVERALSQTAILSQIRTETAIWVGSLAAEKSPRVGLCHPHL